MTEDEYYEKETARGELAFAPEVADCFQCDRFGVEKKIVALGPIVDARRDPTQSYRLECGHLTI